MATRIEIEGLGIVEVDDSFRSKSPEEQNAIVEDIKRQVLASQQPTTSNPLVGAYEAGKRALGGIADFAKGIHADLEANREELQKRGWLGGPGAKDPDALGIGKAVEQASKLNDDAGQYRPSITFDELRSDFNWLNPLKLLQFGGERAITSAPSMAEAVLSPGTFLMGATGNIGQDRARNDGRQRATTGDMLAALPSAIASQQLERLGALRLFRGSPVKGVLAEGVTEGIQSPVEYAGSTVGTQAGFDPREAAAQAAEGLVSGVLAGGVQRGTVDAVRAAPRVGRYVRDFRFERVAQQSPEQFASDLRVARLFDAMKVSQEQAATGTKQSDDVTFKKVQDRISADLKSAITQLYESDQIDREAYDRLIRRKDNILKQADQHNRDLSQDDLDVIDGLSLEPVVKEGLKDAFRDLNTITNAGLKKNASGPLERAARAALPVVAGGIGWNSPAMGVAALAGKGFAIRGARGLDNILGLQQPEILRRIRVAQRRAKAQGIEAGDTGHFLSDLTANAQAGVNVQADAAARETASQRLLRAKRRLVDNPGLDGFDRYIYDKTGLLPSEVDKGLLKLVQDGTITAAQQKSFYAAPTALMEGNQGNVIMDMLNDMAVKGELKRDEGWQGLRPEVRPNSGAGRAYAQQGGFEGIRNIFAYRQAMSTVADATATAQQSAPNAEMRQAVNDIANARTMPAKQALFEQIRASNPQHAQWLDEAVKPLTKFGPKTDEQTLPAGASLGARPTLVGTIPGAPGRLSPSLVPEFRAEGVTSSALDAPVATVETMTKLTPEGAAAYELAQQIKDKPWAADAYRDLEAVQRRAMQALVDGGKQSVLSAVFKAVTGRAYNPSGVDLTAYGTFEGDVSPNMRIPMRKLSEPQRLAILAILGKYLNQAAMAASHFTATTPEQADTYSIAVENEAVDLQAVSEIEKALGYPLNVQPLPNGYSIDINIGGFDTKPTLELVMAAINGSSLRDKAVKVYPMKYASDFIMEAGYDDAINQVQNASETRDAGRVQSDRPAALSDIRPIQSVAEAAANIARQRDKELAEWTKRWKEGPQGRTK